MAGKCLHGLACANVPYLGRGVARSRDKEVGVRRQRDTANTVSTAPTHAVGPPHHIARMVVEFHGARALLNIPEHARHVAGRGDDLPVVYEAAAAQIARVCAELASDLGLAAGCEGVDGADVVEAAAGDEGAGGRIGDGHDPGGAEGDGVNLVGGVCVPDDEAAVLGGGDEVAGVCRPVERVDLGEVALERAAGLEGGAGEGGRVAGHRAHWLSAAPAGGTHGSCRLSAPAPPGSCPSDRQPPAARPRSCPGCLPWGGE